MIDTRQRDLLRAIVEEYVKTARPVGSKSLCKKFKCSSATIRNDMAELESLGYLEKTHISSGRIPSEMGYRYYVDNLMWMWDKIPDGLLTVKKYFISEIIPSKENFNKIGKKILNPIFVGPVRKIEVKKCSTKNQIIINLGGAESFLLEHSLIVDFYNAHKLYCPYEMVVSK